MLGRANTASLAPTPSVRRRPRAARSRRITLLALALITASFASAAPAYAQSVNAAMSASTDGPSESSSSDSIFSASGLPDLSQATEKGSLSNTIQIVILLTVLTVAPSILLMMTSFVRMLIVLVLLRQALGTQQLPPSQVLVGLALFMTILVMAPTWDRIKTDAVDPYLNDEIPQTEAIAGAAVHLRDYMFRQIETSGNEEDVYMMYEYAVQEAVPEDESLTREQVPMTALIPAYLLSELKTSFVLGFRIYLPFLVIDMVIATVLVSMGMMMLPPVLISLPFKLLLFVLADGWHLVGGSLMASVQ